MDQRQAIIQREDLLTCEYKSRFIEPGWSIPRSRRTCYNKKGSPRNHSVLEQIWVKGSYQWLPQGERGPPKESKSQWIEILHNGSQFTQWFLKIKNFRITPKFFFALQYMKNWIKVVPWKMFFFPEKKLLVWKKL